MSARELAEVKGRGWFPEEIFGFIVMVNYNLKQPNLKGNMLVITLHKSVSDQRHENSYLYFL